MTETVLFVGGGMDGKRWVMERLADRIEVPVLRGDPSWVVACFVKSETYILQDFGPKRTIYLISTESPDNLVPLLIEGYRKEKI